MDTNLGQIYDDVLFRSGKNKRGGWISPDVFNINIKTVNSRYMNDLIDAFEKNAEVTSDLQPFIKTLGSPQFAALSFTPVLAGNDSKGGYATIPDDFWYEARTNYNRLLNNACSVDSEYRPVEFVSQHVFDAAMSASITNPIDNPTEAYPLMVISNNLFYVYPFIRRVSLTYIRQPLVPFFDYDIVSGIPVFLPAGSVHINSSVLPAGTPSRTVEFEYPESCVDILTDMIKTAVAVGNENKWNIETQIKPKIV